MPRCPNCNKMHNRVMLSNPPKIKCCGRYWNVDEIERKKKEEKQNQEDERLKKLIREVVREELRKALIKKDE